MNTDILLSRLEHVRRAGNGWRADCPNGHAKARGSLSIAQTDDGTVLLHCFACGDVHGILSAVGLEVGDLFPERIKDTSPKARNTRRDAFRQAGWAAALGVLAREAILVEVAAHDMAEGIAVTGVDHDRLLLACRRIHDVREILA